MNQEEVPIPKAESPIAEIQAGGEVSFANLLKMAETVNEQAKESPTAEIEVKTEILKEEEQAEKREKTDVEQMQESFGAAGFAEYYGIKASETGDEETLKKFGKSEADSLRVQLGNKFKPSDYEWRQPDIIANIASRFENVAAGGEDKFAKEDLLEGAAEVCRDEAGGSVAQYLKTQKALLERDQQGRFAYKFEEKVKSRVEGFGRAALENGDLEIAIDALSFSGKLENSNTVAQLTEKMTVLSKSEKPEDKIMLQRAAKKLIEIKGGK